MATTTATVSISSSDLNPGSNLSINSSSTLMKGGLTTGLTQLRTGYESIATGTPVAAFGVGGLLDVVTPGVTGSLATPYDEHHLARAIVECLDLRDQAAIEGPLHAQRTWEPNVVGGAYKRVYQEAIQWWNEEPSQR